MLLFLVDYYDDFLDVYECCGELLYDGFWEVGFDFVKLDGVYYMLMCYLGDVDDIEFVYRFVCEVGVVVVFGSSFYIEGFVDWVWFMFF